MKKSIITITGFPGSGKSSTAKGVAKLLGYAHISTGDMFRDMAKKRKLTVEEINFAAETQQEIDREVDEFIKNQVAFQTHVVMDSRMAFHWIPESFKVFLNLDPHVAAERTFTHIQKEGRTSQSASSIEEVYNNTLLRRTSEQKRYLDLYEVDINDFRQFDLVVDTAKHNLEEVIRLIVKKYQEWLA